MQNLLEDIQIGARYALEEIAGHRLTAAEKALRLEFRRGALGHMGKIEDNPLQRRILCQERRDERPPRATDVDGASQA